ncbi:MAG: hypothetical protein M3P91_10145 [Actinomycetota bacterium]|nr:hypothetical protein [Actinomycetota bacterium]
MALSLAGIAAFCWLARQPRAVVPRNFGLWPLLLLPGHGLYPIPAPR